MSEFDMDKTAMGGVPPGGDATQMVMEPCADATQLSVGVECPVCHTPNPPSETYCIDCGFMLCATPLEVEDMPEAQSAGKLVAADGTREFALNSGENVVGRESADVLLSHNTVSRKHARITVEDGRAFVEDLGSTNGTFVDGAKIEPGEKEELADGSELMFGSTTFKYRAPEVPSGQIDEQVDEQVAEGEAVEEQPEPAVEEERLEPEQTLATLVSKDGLMSFDIREGINTIGRRQGANAIMVPDPYCSGRHADLVAEDDKLVLTDVGSTNGTFVNGVRLEPNVPREVAAGDEITFGQTAFTVEVA